jgi:hypothetical protein
MILDLEVLGMGWVLGGVDGMVAGEWLDVEMGW